MKWVSAMMMVAALVLGMTSLVLCEGDSSGILSPKVVSAVKQYNAAMEKAEKDYNIAINKATDDLLVALNKAKIETTKAGKLDEALKIDSKIKELELTKQEIAGKMRPEKVVKDVKVAKDDMVTKQLEEKLIGTSWLCSGKDIVVFEKPQPILRGPWGGGIFLWRANPDGTVACSSDPAYFSGTLNDNIIRFSPDGKSFQVERCDGYHYTGTLIEKHK